MIKNILVYLLACLLLFVLSYSIHTTILQKQEITHPFLLWEIYAFQFIITVIICVFFEIISKKVKSLADQLGFFYLGFILLKMTIFYLSFKETLFSSIDLTRIDSFSLLIPTFLFLIIEVYFIAKILNRNN